ncbi:hypothetical protein GINT2_000398 [Glugoides intestinalis]
MSGWDDSDEEENRFKLQPSDFKVVNVHFESKQEPEGGQEPQQEVENELYHEEVFNTEYGNEEPFQARENHFYTKIGFKVGDYFAGEKRIYQKKN